MKTLIVLFLLVFCSNLAHADLRSDATDAVNALRTNTTGKPISNELEDIVRTLGTAESLFKQDDIAEANRYYELTLQKASILKTAANNSNSSKVASQAVGIGLISTISPKAPSKPAATTTTIQSSYSTPSQPDSKVDQEKPADADIPTAPIASNRIIGNINIYTVGKKESLKLVAAKLGVSRHQLIELNKLDPKKSLYAGQKLKYNNRRIIPQVMTDGIIINIPDRTLYYFRNSKLFTSLPVAVGVPTRNKKFNWNTPTGKFRITSKMKDPTWHVPPSIQSEMEAQGKEVIISIPPGPRNPLGKYAMKTSLPGILIHSTTKPASIYSFASHGCIRVYPAHMEKFFKEIKVNTIGEIIYKPVKLAVTDDGRVFLEVHGDAYGKIGGLHKIAKNLIDKENLTNKVDWKKVNNVVKNKSGVAEEVMP